MVLPAVEVPLIDQEVVALRTLEGKHSHLSSVGGAKARVGNPALEDAEELADDEVFVGFAHADGHVASQAQERMELLERLLKGEFLSVPHAGEPNYRRQGLTGTQEGAEGRQCFHSASNGGPASCGRFGTLPRDPAPQAGFRPVPPAGFEPATRCLEGSRSNPLSYGGQSALSRLARRGGSLGASDHNLATVALCEPRSKLRAPAHQRVAYRQRGPLRRRRRRSRGGRI